MENFPMLCAKCGEITTLDDALHTLIGKLVCCEAFKIDDEEGE